jgi:hypothetical protein
MVQQTADWGKTPQCHLPTTVYRFSPFTVYHQPFAVLR